MVDRLSAKWPVTELSAMEIVNGRGFLSAQQTAGLYEMAYSTFVRRLKDFVKHGEYSPGAFRVVRYLNPRNQDREYWMIEVHPVLGIKALNRHFCPRFFE